MSKYNNSQKKDRHNVRTPTDIERKYKLGKLIQIEDYIIETGISGIWEYEKWSSGKAVCWCMTSVSASADPANVYSKNCVLPFEFLNINYYTFITTIQDTGEGSVAFRYYTTTTKSFWIGCNKPSVSCFIYVIGKWK